MVNLSVIDALKFLGQIERGELGRGLLPWVPLMKGSDDAAVIAMWRRLADQEADVDKRKEWAGMAQVFADRAGCGAAWRKTLEEVDMWKSATLEEARAKGMQIGILALYRLKYQQEPPADIITKVEQCLDHDTLIAWLGAAGTLATPDAFRATLPGLPAASGSY